MAEKFKNSADLSNYLRRHGIDIDALGQGNGKGVDSLLEELRKGETTLTEYMYGLRREVAVSGVNVTYGNQILYEDRQEYPDGRVVRRPALPYSITEKHQGRETPFETAIRGLQEELGIVGVSLVGLGSWFEEKDSLAYPGLLARYVYYGFNAALDESQYRPEGYTETTHKKTTFFLWRADNSAK